MMLQEPVRIRDFVVTKNDWIYAVVSYDNEPHIRGFLRYIPDKNGDRVSRDGTRFRKVGFEEAGQLMHKSVHYRDGLCAIPGEDIARVERPRQCVERCDDADVSSVVDFFESYGISRRHMGVTGSRLVGLATGSSDIDFVLYGKRSFDRGRVALRDAVETGLLPEIDTGLWLRIFRKRTPELTFEEFVLHEKRKWNRGSLRATYFDLLFVRDFDEIAIEPRGTDDGFATVRATVTNATYAFDSPAIYEITHETVNKVLSYTHTYAGQAEKGEVIEARGICNEAGVTRLIVGTSRAARGEWIKSCTLLSHNGTEPG
ncbi:MAG TPA: DNA polymerase subunit beta [Candidatus Bathyarchaeia archaeon]|nr:DNA polymerase subunit beta [Candidatus Bathyarchaeia archaeon]